MTWRILAGGPHAAESCSRWRPPAALLEPGWFPTLTCHVLLLVLRCLLQGFSLEWFVYILLPCPHPNTLPNLCCALIMCSKPSESWVEYWLLFYLQSRDPYLPILLGPATNRFHGGRFSAEYPLPSIDSGVHHWTPSTRLNTWQGVGGSNMCWMARQMKSLQSCQSPTLSLLLCYLYSRHLYRSTAQARNVRET